MCNTSQAFYRPRLGIYQSLFGRVFGSGLQLSHEMHLENFPSIQLHLRLHGLMIPHVVEHESLNFCHGFDETVTIVLIEDIVGKLS
jgi:hypothetical protein